jgi:hypothetical protein
MEGDITEPFPSPDPPHEATEESTAISCVSILHVLLCCFLLKRCKSETLYVKRQLCCIIQRIGNIKLYHYVV